MTKVLSIGEIMVEMSDIGNGLYKKKFAGDTFNMAHYMNVVTGGNIRADYLTALGQDADSDECQQFMQKNGVSTERCLQMPDRTIGLFILSNDSMGEKKYGYWRGQSAARALFNETQDLTGYDLVYFSGITAAITENKNNLIISISEAKNQNVILAFDFNYRPKLWSPEQAASFAASVLPLLQVAKISDEELEIIYPNQSIKNLSEAYMDVEWVLTCSNKKAETWKAGKLIAHLKFDQVEGMIDSSAAGDAFIATYLSSKFAGLNPEMSLHNAHHIASQVVCAKGSIVPVDLTKLEFKNVG